ncbi:hypothetical protein RI129_006192 [Pyrocoelia pectoralis]|uniref:Caspase Dronc n=1 Tax=Pyrocoelia pectoralis TaxID=417401 RepID=A0AAN7VC18_9COLE
MEERHREVIQRNYAILVEQCNIEHLLPVLEQKRVFPRQTIDKYMLIDDNLRRKRDVFLDIQTRGPRAFSNLVTSLHETGQYSLAKRLDPTFSFHHTFKKRGSVLVINIIKYHNDLHMERKGAEVDGSNLFDLFTQMGFFVEYHTDLSATKITDVILQFKSSPELVGCDMIFVIVMAHGTINKDVNVSEIIGSDNNVVSTKWIEEQFTNRECKILQNKPKIFMYQMCRGDTPDFGAVQSNIENDSGIRMASASRVMLRSCSDMLIAHSTLPGNVSHRDVYLGTWYISLFCKIMMDHAHDTNLEDIFKLIDYQLSVLRSGKNTMQTSMYTNIGFKTCFVHPGIYLDCNEIRMINEGLTPEVNDNISL